MFGPKIHCQSCFNQKGHAASRQGEGQINLHQKFELVISKNGRDTAQFQPEKNVHFTHDFIA